MAGLAVVLRFGIARGAGSLDLTLVFRIVAGLGILLTMLLPSVHGSNINILLSGEILNWNFLLLACVAGVCFAISGFAAIHTLRYGFLGITWTIYRLSMLIPTFASIFFWHEISIIPQSLTGWLTYTGILGAVLAVIFIGYGRMQLQPDEHKPNHVKAWLFWLAIAFVFHGLWEITLKASSTLADNDQRKAFIVLVFLINMGLAIPLVIIRRKKITRPVIKFGILAGLCSMIGTGMRPWALRYIPGYLAFPATAICVMVIVLIAGVVIWKERLNKYEWIGVAAAILSVVLLAR